MSPFHYLIFAHYIADFALTGDFVAINKGKNWYIMLVHIIIYTFTICFVLDLMGMFATWKMGLLYFSHWGIDEWKCKANPDKAMTTNLYIDQALHILVLIIVGYIN